MLDAWADALGVSSDDQAEAWLAARVGRAADAMVDVEDLAQSLVGVPDEDARGAALAAAEHLRAVVDGLDDARKAFARHERGSR